MEERNSDDSSVLLDFFRVICLCHDVTKVTDRDGNSFLTGPSQDELCLLDMAKETKLVEFIDRDSSVLRIMVQGKMEVYKNIKFYDFTSERKMMTRIVQRVHPETEVPTEQYNQVYVFSKGADTSILARSIPKHLAEALRTGDGQYSYRSQQGNVDNFSEEEQSVVDHIETYAAKGYRTLAFGYKQLQSPIVDGVYT